MRSAILARLAVVPIVILIMVTTAISLGMFNDPSAPVTSANFPWAVTVPLGVGIAAIVTLAISYAYSSARTEVRETEARDAVEVAFAEITDPFDLKSLINLNRKQMEQYDAQARSQSNTSHWISLLAMLAGLGIVIAGIWVAITADETSTKYATAIIATVGTTVGGYIAKTFITLNTSTQDQARYYFEQPLVASYLMTAERFIARMPEQEQADQYRILVQAAISQAAAVPGSKPRLTTSVAPARTARRRRQTRTTTAQ